MVKKKDDIRNHGHEPSRYFLIQLEKNSCVFVLLGKVSIVTSPAESLDHAIIEEIEFFNTFPAESVGI